MDLPLTLGYVGRPRLKMPTLRLVNAFAETSAEGPEQYVRTRRPGISLLNTVGTGPILAQYQQLGAFNGSTFSVSGNGFYKDSALVATVAYSSAPRMAAANGQLALVSGGGLYIYTNGALTPQLTFNDGVSLLPPFTGVYVLYNIFIYPVVGSDMFFFSTVGNPESISAANFSAAQTAPDAIVEIGILNEEIYIFGQTSIEIWDFNGSINAPFALSPGRTYARGCAGQNTVAKLDNALFWIGDDNVVYRSGAVPKKVSTPLIDDRILAEGAVGVSTARCFKVETEGHVFYVMNLYTIGETWAYDCQTEQWAQWGTLTGASSAPSVFRCSTCVGQGQNIQLGDYLNGNVYLLDQTNPTDNGYNIPVTVSGFHAMDGGRQRNTNVSLHCIRGNATATTPAPIVQMRYSDDGAQTWTSWIPGYIGMAGDHNYKASWRSLGIMQQPGRYFEFRISDPVITAIQGATMNEARI